MMNKGRNRYSFFLAPYLIGILLLSIGCNPSQIGIYQSEIDTISSRWVPDQREGICKISLVAGSNGSLILRGETTVNQAKLDIINTLYNHHITFVDSILILPDTIANQKYNGLVSLSVINMRKYPAQSAEMVSQALLGTPVLILKSKDSWLLIQTPDKYIAWTESSSVKLMSTNEMGEWREADRIIFLDNSGWIYSSPGESGVVGDIVSGSILKKTGVLKGFIKVILPDGREGFIKSEAAVDFDNWKTLTLCTEDKVCSIASTFLGLPYLWGGTSSKGVDCSGFVHTVYFLNGIILSRDASLQAKHGITVNITQGYSQLKKGDLLFFGSKVNSMPHVTHVAIYIGNSEYINSSGRVMINSLDSTFANYNSYRENSLLIAKRIIGSADDIGVVPVSKHCWY
jgi:gamma-D-glutamyl-L-lysine dipeptidyl-peptidase